MHCLNCGYSLKDLREAKCPECGQEFDPLDETTYRSPDRMTVRSAQLLGSVSAVGSLVLLGMFPIAVGHGGIFLFMLAGIPPFAIILLAWLAMCITAGFVSKPGTAAVLLSLCIGSLLLFWALVLLLTKGSLLFWPLSAGVLFTAAVSIKMISSLHVAHGQFRSVAGSQLANVDEVVVVTSSKREQS